AKELGHNGSISDDLLFIGMERSKGGKYKFHLIPVEVKVGQNSSQVVSKATEQIKNIYRLIKNELLTASENTFTQDFYRSFFLTLYFGNLKKFIDNGILTDNRFHEIFNLRSKVLNGEIEFTDQINKRYSEGLILLFTQGSSFRKMVKQSQSNIYEVHLTENDAYRDADREYHDIDIEMKKGKKGIDPSSFLSHNMLEEIEEISNVTYDQEYKKRDPDTLPIDDKHKNGNIASSRDIEKEDYKVEEIGPVSKSDTDIRLKADYSINNVRILLGKIKGSNENLYWEYGDHNLTNRHMLISGKSGQGKTYFMQCLLLEMSKNRIDSLIVDYTDGFLNNQLEETFVSRMDEKLKTKFVFVNKLPINPFRRNEIDLGGVLMPETDDDIADRVVQIVDFVFNLGIQQNSLLKEVVKRG